VELLFEQLFLSSKYRMHTRNNLANLHRLTIYHLPYFQSTISSVSEPFAVSKSTGMDDVFLSFFIPE